MPWRGNTKFHKVGRAAILAAVIVLVSAPACTRQEAIDTLGKTAEGVARGACKNAGNCQNTCPDGSIARGPLYSCP